MGLVKLALETSVISENPQDARLLPTTVRKSPQPWRKKPNKNIMNMGMKEDGTNKII